MVYCANCGTKNPDEAVVCAKCGAKLYVVGETRRYRRREEEECFGIPHGGAVVGLAIGAIIVLWGLIWLLQRTGAIAEDIEVWPFAIIVFGILIIVGALYGLGRRRH